MITIAFTDDDELGEVEGAFLEDGQLLHAWSCNDAIWRNEYFGPLMNRLGFHVFTSRATPEQRTKLAEFFLL